MVIEKKLQELFNSYCNLISSITDIEHPKSSNVHDVIELSLQKIFESFDPDNICKITMSHHYYDIYEMKIIGWVSNPKTLIPFQYIEAEIDPRYDFKNKTHFKNKMHLILYDVIPDYNKNNFIYHYRDQCSFLYFVYNWIPLTHQQKIYLIDKSRLILY